MVKTALDDLALPPYAHLLGWRLLDACPEEGRITVGFDGKPGVHSVSQHPNFTVVNRPCSRLFLGIALDRSSAASRPRRAAPEIEVNSALWKNRQAHGRQVTSVRTSAPNAC
jgi:hypothetical protein